jgi:glycine cleavage system H protein
MTKYSFQDVFVRTDKKFAYVGISELYCEQLDRVEYINFPEIGEVFAEDDLFTIDTVSDSFHFISPVSGEVVEINEEIENDPINILESTEFSGWLCKIKLSDKSELDDMMTYEKYRDFLEGKDEFYD